MIPKEIKIGGFVYEIVNKPLLKEYGEERCGKIIPSQLKILITNEINMSAQEQTLIHETIEAINVDCDLDLTHQTISTLASCLYQVFKDNKIVLE